MSHSACQVHYKYGFRNSGSWPEVKDLGRFGLKITFFMKFDTLNKSDARALA